MFSAPDDTVGTNPTGGGSEGGSEPEDGGNVEGRQPPELPEEPGAGADGTDVIDTAGGQEEDVGPADSSEGVPDDLVIPPPPPTRPYTVQSGDTMDSIALWWFGSAAKWVLIAQENPLVDPMRLRSGQTLRLPAKDAAVERIPPEVLDDLLKETRYVVAPNDTLSGIARQFYSNPNLWRIIYDANRDVVPNPDSLKLGVELIIPRFQVPAE
ncbi:MAG: LysM peptidoglycan-binding domain-containing protein [Planctomycetes bacterium]|nr:LysM peptidoglycan-binding domain-containing protein [Planctomycetota bacterium]